MKSVDTTRPEVQSHQVSSSCIQHSFNNVTNKEIKQNNTIHSRLESNKVIYVMVKYKVDCYYNSNK